MNDHDRVLDDVAVYALGAVSAQDAQRIRAHIESCETCSAEYERLVPVIDAIASATTLPDGASAGPSAALRKRVLGTAQPKRTVVVWPVYALAAACLIITLMAGVFAGMLKSQNAALRHTVASDKALIDDLASTSSKRYLVPGGAVVSRGGRLYIAMQSMPPLPNGKVYQAWVLPAGQKRMSPSITFTPVHGVAILRVPVDAMRIVAFAVSVEPRGGSAQPTAKPNFVIKLAKA